ncbi:hypothetical protein [Pseudomonas sp. BIGb0164]|uniref:hypothetical protein n=1 Tax=Pseudomonas sp. BIGb0164 TaxID=2940605 RepID=UPI002167CCA8|nr:hypothetical protein [Pseudomonas sp. BIGb0164]MCS4250760.1 hypothetical protein [Pseudomonas sp. BIGb0164]
MTERWQFECRLIRWEFTVKRLRMFHQSLASKRSQGMRSVEHSPPAFTRIPLAAIGVGLGLAVAVYTTGKGPFFLENFASSWLPQAAVLCIALLCKASRESLGGMAVAMALYLFLFHLWVTDAMGWLFYLFSFPGILIGALLGVVFSPSRKVFKALVAFAWVVTGIGGNLAVLAVMVT